MEDDDDDMNVFRGQISQKHVQVMTLIWNFINHVSLSFSKYYLELIHIYMLQLYFIFHIFK